MIAHCLTLDDRVDRIGATFDADRPYGEMNAWGNSFPAEEIPFGDRIRLARVPYALVRKPPGRPARPDHLEALGQRLPGGPPDRPVTSLALLAAGELGDQQLSLRVHLKASEVREVSVTVPGWLVRPEQPLRPAQIRCEHLHYPGGYGLDLLRPALWGVLAGLPGTPVTGIELMPNPLVHVFAVTLLTEEAG